MRLIGFLFIGIIAGWLASQIFIGQSLGIFQNLIVGVIGALVGGSILDFVYGKNRKSNMGCITSIIVSTLGAIVFLFILTLISKAL